MSMTSNLEPRWKAYTQAIILAAPALFVWAVGVVFLFPKIKTMWADAGFSPPFAMTAMKVSDIFKDYSLPFIAVALVGLVLLEWRASLWPRFRRACLSAGVFCINTFVLLLLSIIVISFGMIVPELLRR